MKRRGGGTREGGRVASGYSGRPLLAKLGIKPEMHIAILNAPRGYERVLGK